MPTDTVETTQADSSAAPSLDSTLTRDTKEAWNAGESAPKPKAASTTAKESSAAQPEKGKQAESESASEAEHKQEKSERRSNAETRIKELLAENKRLKAEREGRQETKETKAEPSTAKPVEPPKALEAPKKPEQKDFKTFEEFETAKEKYFEDLADYKAKKAVEDSRQTDAQNAQKAQLQKELGVARERYGESFDSTIKPVIDAIVPDQKIPPIIKDLIGSSEYAFDIMFVLGGNKAELDGFIKDAQFDPANPAGVMRAIRKAVLLEKLVVDELAAKKNGESGKTGSTEKSENQSPAATKREAPRATAEVGGRATAPEDVGKSAAASGDYRTASRHWTQDYVARNKR